ncbi:MAG TPA: ATP-dependent sacrificial sulfur transferase LarE [Polyangiaceae bacterium]|nr:ATP-dependent sacrificial sulfur transferase LarE [Polyangiaceae bacterium]
MSREPHSPSPSDATVPGALPSRGSPDRLSPDLLLERLRGLTRELGSAIVCYSGGIDSALVLAVSHEQLAHAALGLTAVSPSLAPSEREDAGRLAASIGARHEFVDSHEIDRPEYVANGPDRCFHCKSELYDIARRRRDELGFAHILNGTNADDLGDYRPGLEAARLAGIRSPLVELGFDKADVRAVAQLLGLPIWNKPAAACLSSRIPYGTAVTRERLSQIAGFEQDLRDLGFSQARVRWHGKIARIELAVAELPRALEPERRQRLVAAGKRHGFNYVTLDLEGYRVGSHNEVLPGHALRVIQ